MKKKILALLLVVAVIFGVGLVAKKTVNQAGDPPIGSSPTSSTVVNSPIGS